MSQLPQVEISMAILPTKGNIQTIARHIIQDVKDGFADPLETAIKVEGIKKVCEAVRDGLEGEVRAELMKYGRDAATKLDAKIEASETGTKYDYSGDIIWCRINDQITPLVEKLKQREAMLKTLTSSITEVDPETGEVIIVSPPNKTSKSSFKITLGK